MKPKDGKKYRKKEKPAPWRSNEPKEKEKEKSPTEVTIEKDDPNVDHNESYSILILHVGSRLIEVTSTSDESRAATWITETLQEQRRRHQRGRGAPLVVSLCAFKGVSYSKRSWSLKGPKCHPNHPSNPYLAISICLGGSHILLYRHHAYNGDSFSIKPLEHLVDDKKVVMVGMPIKEIAKKLQDQCGLRIKCPVDLRLLISGAYGKDSLRDDMVLEEMARIPLEGIRLEMKPARVLEADWSYDYIFHEEEEMELIKYAARDAFISYEIAAMCIQKTGLPSDSEAAPAED